MNNELKQLLENYDKTGEIPVPVGGYTKENINNYISASSDFSAYQAQPLEADASEYASERVEEYMLELSHNTI